jgi:nucleotide-binding universal stress UspA family protein
MRNLLVPVDGSDRSIEAIETIRELYSPERVNITLILVREDIDSNSSAVLKKMERDTMPVLDRIEALMPEYNVNKVVRFGIAGNEIIKYARESDTEMIVITKRTHTAASMFLGSVAIYLVKYSHLPVIVLPERKG